MNDENLNKKRLRQLVNKLFKAQITQEEKQLLDDWYLSKEEEDPIVYTDLSKEEYKEKLYQATLDKIKKGDTKRNEGFTFLTKLAASVSIICVAATVLFYFLTSTEHQEFLTYKSEKGERKKIELQDGTQVYLNGNSVLKVNKEFDEARHVMLEGEAFFKVKRNESLPFQIKTHQLTTTVLGTSFNINARSEANESVAVKSGKVMVASNRKEEEVIIEKGEQAIFYESNLSSSQIENEDLVFGWQSEKLVFFNETINGVAKKLEEWYGVEVEVFSKTSKECLITGTYKNLTIDQLLEIIQYSTNINYTINEKKVMIINEGC
ncbi:FecR family protein [Echinicola sp. CAU 1574]|uniref:FecR family protein n=1 Tax=Echinicola arenosa TaxID=2774144 RepID=A0ABR9AHL4_9BACT|nr:FecR family protein [Echinicola arenosa]MBD8487817.1 FecR family protein [Echinicola arenosa]